MCFRLICISQLIGLILIAAAYGQMPADKHESHHPEEEQGEQSTSEPSANNPLTMKDPKGSMMGSGMKERQTANKREEQLYPSLMEMPELTSEELSRVMQQSYDRRQKGISMLSKGWEQLSSAIGSNNYEKINEAILLMQDGLSQYETGLAAERALSEGKDPRKIALQWFKREMHLLPPVGLEQNKGPFGLSWFHIFTMVIIIIFTILMLFMYWAKMKRASSLIENLNQIQPTGDETQGQHNAAQATSSAEPSTRPREKIAQAETGPPSPTTVPPQSPTNKDPVSSGTNAGNKPTKWSGRLRVARIFQETPNVKTFRFVNPEGGPLPFLYLPGQFLILTINSNGNTFKRSYTIASSPSRNHYCEVTIKREDMGTVSGYMHDNVRENDILEISAPNGVFTFTGREADSIVLIAGGVGITPFMSTIRYLTDIGWQGDIYLLFSCRTSVDFIFREELEFLQRRSNNLHVFATMTRAEGNVWMGLKGKLDKNLISSFVPDITKHRIHICGPPPMMEAITQILEELGVPADQIKTEAFGPAIRPAAKKALAEGCECEKCDERRRLEQAKRDTVLGDAQPSISVTTPTVTFQESNQSAPLPPDETILDVADEIGVEIPYVCRIGVCGTCRIKLLSGSVNMETKEGLEPGDKEQGIILACQAKSTENVTVEA